MNALPQQDDADPSRHPVRCRAHKFGGSSLADAGRIRHVAGLMLDAEDFAWLTAELRAIADRHGEGRVVSMLEGGYNLDALAESAVAHVGVLRG